MEEVLELFARLADPLRDPRKEDLNRMSYLIGRRVPESTARLCRLVLTAHFLDSSPIGHAFSSDAEAVTFFIRICQHWPWIWCYSLKSKDPFIRREILDSIVRLNDIHHEEPPLDKLNISQVFTSQPARGVWTSIQDRVVDRIRDVRIKALQFAFSILRTTKDEYLIRSTIRSLIGRSHDYSPRIRAIVLQNLELIPTQNLDRNVLIRKLTRRLLDRSLVVRETAIFELSYAWSRTIADLNGPLLSRPCQRRLILTLLTRYTQSGPYDRYLMERVVGQYLVGHGLVTQPRRAARNLIHLIACAPEYGNRRTRSGPEEDADRDEDDDEEEEDVDGTIIAKLLIHLLRNQERVRFLFSRLIFTDDGLQEEEMSILETEMIMDESHFRSSAEAFVVHLCHHGGGEAVVELQSLLTGRDFVRFGDVSRALRWLLGPQDDNQEDEEETHGEEENDTAKEYLNIFRRRFFHKTGLALLDHDVILALLNELSEFPLLFTEPEAAAAEDPRERFERESERISRRKTSKDLSTAAAHLLVYTMAAHTTMWTAPSGCLMSALQNSTPWPILDALEQLLIDWSPPTSDDCRPGDELRASLREQVRRIVIDRRLRSQRSVMSTTSEGFPSSSSSESHYPL